MEQPSRAFLQAMTRGDGFGGVDYEFLANCTTEFLIGQIGILKEVTENTGVGLRKHRAMILKAELDPRPDFQRPRTTTESTAMDWLDSQILRESGV